MEKCLLWTHEVWGFKKSAWQYMAFFTDYPKTELKGLSG